MVNQIRETVEQLFKGKACSKEEKEKVIRSLEAKYKDLVELGKTPQEALEIVMGSIQSIDVHLDKETEDKSSININKAAEERKPSIVLKDKKVPQSGVRGFIGAMVCMVGGIGIILALIVANNKGNGSNFDEININDSGTSFIQHEGLNAVKQEEADIQGIDTIVIKMGRAQVNLDFVDSEKISVKETSEDSNPKELFGINKQGNTLNIERKDLGITWGKEKLHIVDISLPLTYKDKLEIETGSGDVNFLSEAEVSSLKISLASGTFRSQKRIQAGSMKLSSSSGDLKAEELETDEYKIETASGDISVQNIIGKGKVASASGNIYLKVEDLSGDLDVEAASGDIGIDFISGINAKLKIETLSGDIDGNMKWENKAEHRAEALLGSDGGATVKVATASGDISINER